MKAKFVIYALLVSLVCTILSWSRLLNENQSGGSSRSSSGSSWSSSSGGSWGGGGGHK